MSGLARRADISKIVYVIADLLTLTSLLKMLWGGADRSATAQWRRIFRSGWISSELDGRITIVHSLCVVPPAIRFIGEWVGISFMNKLRIRQVRNLLDDIEFDNLVLWVSSPEHTAELVGRFGEQKVCYCLCEDYLEKHAPDSAYRKLLAADDEYLTKRADLLMVASRALFDKKKGLNRNTHLVPNGVANSEILGDALREAPKELEGIPHPIIGHFGLLGTYSETALVKRIAQAYPQASIVLIGPVQVGENTRRLWENLPNVHLLGSRPAALIPEYLSQFDVSLMLYSNTYQNVARDSMKVYHYLAAGKPIVSYSAAGADQFADAIYLAHNQDHFVTLVGEALSENSLELKEKRQTCARENSWDIRVEQVHSLIKQELSKSPKGS
ncbi:glycosyltransferase [Elusimicrobiota bacterium]